MNCTYTCIWESLVCMHECRYWGTEKNTEQLQALAAGLAILHVQSRCSSSAGDTRLARVRPLLTWSSSSISKQLHWQFTGKSTSHTFGAIIVSFLWVFQRKVHKARWHRGLGTPRTRTNKVLQWDPLVHVVYWKLEFWPEIKFRTFILYNFAGDEIYQFKLLIC